MPFHHVFLPDAEPTSQPVKKRNQAALKQASPQELLAPTTSSSPAPSCLESSMMPQFFSIVHPDGVEISCGDLVTVVPTSTDLAFIVIEIYQQDSREIMTAQKSELSDGMAVKLTDHFNMTCPVTSIHKVDTKISPHFTKTAQDVCRKAILLCADSQRQNVFISLHLAYTLCLLWEMMQTIPAGAKSTNCIFKLATNIFHSFPHMYFIITTKTVQNSFLRESPCYY